MAEQQQDKDQRTEEATPQRLRKAREDGQIGFSSEFVGGVLLMATSLLAWLAGESFLGRLLGTFMYRLTYFEREIEHPQMAVVSAIESLQYVGGFCIAVMIPLSLAATISGLVQTGFNISFKPLQLDVGKLSVVKGFSKMFSSQGAFRGGLSIVKATAIAILVTIVLTSNIREVALSGFHGFNAVLALGWDVLLQAGFAVSLLLLIVGVADLAFQKWKHMQDMRMSMKDIKDEQKETDGDPMIKARIRKLQADMNRQRMLSDVPQASVVVTNPTHFAVALKYDSTSMDSPVVIAKGADHLAKKIIEIAKENGVAVVERKPVARFLYKNVKIGSPIPFELYQTVAEILSFVNRMRSSV